MAGVFGLNESKYALYEDWKNIEPEVRFHRPLMDLFPMCKVPVESFLSRLSAPTSHQIQDCMTVPHSVNSDALYHIIQQLANGGQERTASRQSSKSWFSWNSKDEGDTYDIEAGCTVKEDSK
jgi:hypothetical protein